MQNKNLLLGDFEMNRGDLLQVFSASLGRALLIQRTCAEIIANQDWELQFSAGEIRFGAKKYPLQFIGSESNQSSTWMWGWNNVNNFPDSVIRLAQAARDFGERHHLAELKNPQLRINDINNGLILSVIACNLSEQNCCYFRVPHEHGNAWVAFSEIPEPQTLGAAQIMSVILDSIRKYDLDHRLFLQAFLTQNGTSFENGATRITAQLDQKIVADFDDKGRIISMNLQ